MSECINNLTSLQYINIIRAGRFLIIFWVMLSFVAKIFLIIFGSILIFIGVRARNNKSQKIWTIVIGILFLAIGVILLSEMYSQYTKGRYLDYH